MPLASLPSADADIVLRDGSTVHVRAVTAADEDGLRAFLARLDEESRYLRFFSGGVDLARSAAQMAHPAAGGHGLLAVTGDGRIVGHGAYARSGLDREVAEIAFAVDADWRGMGIATLLLGQLAEHAATAGVTTFTAVVLAANHRMIEVFRESGFPTEVRAVAGELEVTFPTALDAPTRRAFEDRDRHNAVAAVAHVLRPASVVLVGASERTGSVGEAVLRNVLAAGYTGTLHLVNGRGGTVKGHPALRSVRDLPAPAELAVVCVPAEHVVDVARDCAALGVRALVVISAGFSESGAEGRARERELLEVCRAGGLRLVGPNGLGVLSTDPAVSLNATFAPGTPVAGAIGFASQSGAFGITAAGQAAARGAGLSSFVSLGDKADLSGNDLLQFWEEDPRTAVIGLYVESFGNPRRFGQIARRVTASKPVVIVKSGRTAAGHRAASSHTGALLAASDTSVDALLRASGVIRTDTVEELFDVAALLSRQPLPAGPRVAVVTNAGGPGILGVDACEAAGLRVPALGEATRRTLREAVPHAAAVANPVDLIASASAEDYRAAVRAVLDDPDVDAVITVFVRPLETHASAVADAIESVAARKPVLGVFLGPDVPPCGEHGIARFRAVEEAVRALAHVTAYARHRAAAPDPPPVPPAERLDRATAIVAEGLAAGAGWLAPDAVQELLDCHGIPTVPGRIAATPAEVRRVAAVLGGRVAVKAVAPGLVHKTDAGAVALDCTPVGAERAAARMRAALRRAGSPPTGFQVQRMAPPGAELLVGVVGDPRFGPLVAVGAGGVAAELLGDVQVRLAPVGRREAGAMLRGLRTFPLLTGYRGRPKADVDAAIDVVVRAGVLAAAHPEIAELDLNPVMASPDGAVAVDARVRVHALPPARPFGALDK